jgi:hypothetical protein
MTTDVHTLSGAYALDALNEQEAAEFREHLRGCQACRDEVRELRSAAARMGAAEAATPPPALRTRVLEAAARTPQQPPSGVSAAAVAMRRSTKRRRRTWLAAAAAAVILVGGGAVGVGALLGDDEPQQQQLASAPAEVFEADDARTASVSTANGGTLRVAVSPGANEMAVDTRDLPALDAEHAYQLWTIHDDSATNAGVLEPGATGAAMALPAGQTQVAVTIEPSGGSEQPTTQPIAVVDPAEV